MRIVDTIKCKGQDMVENIEDDFTSVDVAMLGTEESDEQTQPFLL